MNFGAFNIFQVYQYFTIYRWYFFFNLEQFSWISCATLFKTGGEVKVPGTAPYWEAWNLDLKTL